MKILIKVSGDLVRNEKVLNYIKELSKDNTVALIYGFGTEFSKRLKEKEIPFEFVDGIRKVNEEGLKIGYALDKEIRSFLFHKFKTSVLLVGPICDDKDKGLINTNADVLFEGMKHAWDKCVIVTMKGRDKSKFKNCEILYF